MKSGYLEQAIKSYKFKDQKYWAIIFARVLMGFLEDQSETFRRFDLIVASPTYVGPNGRTWDHTRLVIETANDEPGGEDAEGEWPFDVGWEHPAIIKTAPTPSMTGKTWKQRHEIAQSDLRNALTVPDPGRTEGLNILVYDDVFTDGHTLNEVARCLTKQGGAVQVCGLTLARQPWKR